MAEFLSIAWLRELDTAARASGTLTAFADHRALVIEQRVHDAPEGTVTYHLKLGPEHACVVAGPAPAPDVVLITDYEQAARLHQGIETAEEALTLGRLKLSGDLTTILDRETAIRAFDDVFAAVRAETTFPDPS